MSNAGIKTIKQVETKMAQTLSKELNIEVDVTMRCGDKWTISGCPESVNSAAQWLSDNNLMFLEETATYFPEDDDPDWVMPEMYAYMTSAK